MSRRRGCSARRRLSGFSGLPSGSTDCGATRRAHLGWPYALLLAAALALVILHRRRDSAVGQWPTSYLGAVLAAVALLTALSVSVSLSGVGSMLAGLSSYQLLVSWLVSGLSIVAVCHLWDRRHADRIEACGLDRLDAAIAIALFAGALGLRAWGLTVEPPGLAFDEGVPLARTLALAADPSRPLFIVDDMAMPGIFHYVMIAFLNTFGWISLDTVWTAKLASVVLGSLSVAAFFLVVRLVSQRSIAVVVGGFLLLQGWHWLYSRFYYLYAGDLCWIAAALVSTVAGLKTRRLALIALGGVFAAIGLAWWKTAALAGPLVGVVVIESLLSGRLRAAVRPLAPVAASLVPFLIMVTPIVVQTAGDSRTVWRFEDVQKKRDEIRARKDMGQLEAYARGALEPFMVLQVRYGNFGRYSFRPQEPVLNFIVSALATVGFVWCLWNFRRERSARICLIGFLLLLWPVVSSYPEDMPASMPRRAVGASLFVGWMTGQGACVLAQTLLPGAGWPFLVTALVVASNGFDGPLHQDRHSARRFRALLARGLRHREGARHPRAAPRRPDRPCILSLPRAEHSLATRRRRSEGAGALRSDARRATDAGSEHLPRIARPALYRSLALGRRRQDRGLGGWPGRSDSRRGLGAGSARPGRCTVLQGGAPPVATNGRGRTSSSTLGRCGLRIFATQGRL